MKTPFAALMVAICFPVTHTASKERPRISDSPDFPPFKQIDKNRDGCLDRKEAEALKKALARMLDVHKDRLIIEFENIDANDNGVIDFPEYLSVKQWRT